MQHDWRRAIAGLLCLLCAHGYTFGQGQLDRALDDHFGYLQRDTLLHNWLSLHQQFHTNPAYAGLQGRYSLEGAYSSRWERQPATPWGMGIRIEAALPDIRSGFGGGVRMQRFGGMRTLDVDLAYNYRIYLGDYHYLGIGLLLRVWNHRIDPLPNPYPARPADNRLNEPVTELNNTQFMPGLGLWYTFRNLNLGVAIVNPLRPSYSYLQNPPADGQEPIPFGFHASAAFHGEIAEGFTMIPHAQIAYEAQFRAHVGLQLVFARRYMIGVATNTETILPEAGLILSDWLRLTYRLGTAVSDFGSLQPGLQHQANLRITLGYISKQ